MYIFSHNIISRLLKFYFYYKYRIILYQTFHLLKVANINAPIFPCACMSAYVRTKYYKSIFPKTTPSTRNPYSTPLIYFPTRNHFLPPLHNTFNHILYLGIWNLDDSLIYILVFFRKRAETGGRIVKVCNGSGRIERGSKEMPRHRFARDTSYAVGALSGIIVENHFGGVARRSVWTRAATHNTINPRRFIIPLPLWIRFFSVSSPRSSESPTFRSRDRNVSVGSDYV